MRRSLKVVLAAVALGSVTGLPALAGSAVAADSSTTTASPTTSLVPPGSSDEAAANAGPVEVIQVSGLIDPVIVTFIEHSIDRAVKDKAEALVIQMNSKQAVVSDQRMAELARRITESPVAVAIWVGPSGARAYGAPGQLLGVAAAAGVAPNSRIGKFGDPLPVPASISIDFGALTPQLRAGTAGYTEANAVLHSGPGRIDPLTIGHFVNGLDGLQYKGHTLATARQIETKGGPALQVLKTRSYKLELLDQLFHTVASPPVAYLLLTIGLLLLVFEFYTAGVGVAGLTGVICLVLAAYGIEVLPHRNWALALVVLSVLAFSVDVQTGVPRFWTTFGVVIYVIGSVWIWDGVSMSWVAMAAGIGGTLLAVLTGMPSMVRTRFATPTIGRDWMIGEFGEAVTAVAPDGVVMVRGAQWRAHTNRATPLAAGDRVRVAAIDGTVLEIEPTVGAARDYRERRPSPSPSPAEAGDAAAQPVDTADH